MKLGSLTEYKVNYKLKNAWLLARKAHEKQKDDSGNDYFHAHVFPVYEIIKFLMPEDFNLQKAALLHDTLEDTSVTYEELESKFGKDVANLVNEVTHEGKKDEYGYYFPRLKTKRAIILKLVDRAQNLSRMDAWNAERQQQYLNKTKFWKDGRDRNGQD